MNAYEKAINLLKIRPHYSAELAKKLAWRGFEKLDIEKVINRLVEKGLLNDVQYAQMYTEELIRNKTFGFYGLKAKLMQRGIPGTDAESLLKENLSLEKEKEIAQRVVERAGEIDKVKLAQKLSRKGFRSEVIHSFLRAS
jgi:regulatory protein